MDVYSLGNDFACTVCGAKLAMHMIPTTGEDENGREYPVRRPYYVCTATGCPNQNIKLAAPRTWLEKFA